MKRNRKLVRQAQHLSSTDLFNLLRHSTPSISENYHLEVAHASELSQENRDGIFDLFERNMKGFYEQSNDGYQAEEKRQELFSNQSRYLFLRTSEHLVAFTHFRFDMDYSNRVLYLYELQVNRNYQGQGLGQWLIEQLKILCQQSQMTKIVLTVHKTNTKAIDFYRNKCQFEIDSTDPNDECEMDYLILSLPV